MRPLTEAQAQKIGPAPVEIAENNNGIEKSWFFTSTASAGAAYGLIGAIVSATMDAIINAGPSRRAQKAADEMAELVSLDELNASLKGHFEHQISATAARSGVSFTDVRTAQRAAVRDAALDKVAVTATYTLSEDASTLRVAGVVTYQSDKTPYASPYAVKGALPKSETIGPVYRNTFTYYSTQLPVPTLTPELRERLVRSIQDSARDANGALPQAGTSEFKSMEKEIAAAQDDKLTKDEIAIFLSREWLRDHGAPLRAEIDQAHAFIARYALLDMNRAVVPSMTGQDELLETAADKRTVRRLGTGLTAGSYVSSAGDVESFSTYGNAIGVAAVHTARLKSLKDASRGSANAAPKASAAPAAPDAPVKTEAAPAQPPANPAANPPAEPAPTAKQP